MKKLLFLFTLALSVTFIGCSSDDDNGGAAEAETVVGSWEIYEVYSEYQIDDLGSFDETFSTDVCPMTPVVTFNSDGSMTATDFEVDYDFDDNVECFIDGELDGTWEDLGEGNFRLVLDGDTDDVEIRLGNNNNRIFIKFEDDDFFEGSFEFRGNRI